MNLRGSNFVVTAHKFHTTPEDDLVAYLNRRGAENILHICHSFSDTPHRRSYYRWYKNGTLVRERRTRDYAWLPEPLLYAKELLFTTVWVLTSSVRWDRFVGLDGLCSTFGLVLRLFRKVDTVAFWNIDLVPEGRFDRPWKDAVYRRVNRFAALRADEMWDHTELMVAEKRRILGLTPMDYRTHRVVPLGIWTDRMPREAYSDCDKHTLVFMGHLLEKQGVQLVLRAIPRIVDELPDFQFKVIGTGAYEAELKRLTRELGVADHVNFRGRIEDDEEMEREIAECGAGIAPYIRELDTFTQFGADPGKIKTYLGCGVPILLTDVPWIASDVEARGCGFIVSERADDIAAMVTKVLSDPDVNQRCRENAAEFAREFDWDSIFQPIDL